ncbi:hypothetical protein SESBI_02168 [Sesbania bispinosa]|nr:hypothetical protein SESBI_02168 [Sesbania bispinosa]
MGMKRNVVSYKDAFMGENGSDSDSDDSSDGSKSSSEYEEGKSEYKRACKQWKLAVIVKLLGKKVGLKFMQNRLEKMWRPLGDMEVMDMENDYFLVRFSSPEDYEHVFQGGPWMIMGFYLVVQKWRPEFFPRADQLKHVAVWNANDSATNANGDGGDSSNVQHRNQNVSTPPAAQDNADKDKKDIFGPWMLVQRAARRRGPNGKVVVPGKDIPNNANHELSENVGHITGSRFQILTDSKDSQEENSHETAPHHKIDGPVPLQANPHHSLDSTHAAHRTLSQIKKAAREVKYPASSPQANMGPEALLKHSAQPLNCTTKVDSDKATPLVGPISPRFNKGPIEDPKICSKRLCGPFVSSRVIVPGCSGSSPDKEMLLIQDSHARPPDLQAQTQRNKMYVEQDTNMVSVDVLGPQAQSVNHQ